MPRAHGLRGVDEQIDEDLLEERGVAEAVGEIGNLHAERPFAERRPELPDDFDNLAAAMDSAARKAAGA